MKIELNGKVSFNLSENIGHNKNILPYILTIWEKGNEIVIWLTPEEYHKLKEEIK